MLAYAPASLFAAGEVNINPWSWQSLGQSLYLLAQTGPSAGAWPASGLVIFVPFTVPEPVTITKVWWAKGAIAGNVDAGIYATDGTLLVSAGTTAVSAGANQVQVVDITDTTLGAGTYYMAMCADTTTTLTIDRVSPAAGICQGLGLLEQAGVTLPLSTGASPATFAVYTRAFIPRFGLQGYRAVGP